MLTGVMLCAALSGVASAQEALGTFDFESGAGWTGAAVDDKERHGGLKSLRVDGDASVSQRLDAAAVRGKRVKVTGWVRTGGAPAYLWVRATGGTADNVGDDVRKRGTKSSKGWTRVEVTLQVPHDAEVVEWGLAGSKGAAWFDDLIVTAGDERPQEIERLK